MKLFAVLPISGALLALAACGSTPAVSLEDATPVVETAPACSEVRVVGAPVTAKVLDEGCTYPSGTTSLGGWWECSGGPRLYGDNGLFGFEGETFAKGGASSRAYKAAYAKCHKS